MKTPMGCFANTFPRELICADGAPKTSKQSPTHSTLAQEKPSDGELLLRRSTSTYYCFNKRVLLPPVEPRQFTSWSFTERIRDAGLMPSFGSVGDAFDNAMMESFWSSMQNELLNRKKWKTRLELTNAIFDYIEVFYNRQRRHSSLDYVSPVEFELSMNEEKTA
jgi:transposase InsO family protein